jgi:hypothetical protein
MHDQPHVTCIEDSLLEKVPTDESNVVDGIRVLKTGLVRETAKGRYAGENGIGLRQVTSSWKC